MREDWGKSENISEHRVEDKQMVKAAFFDIDGIIACYVIVFVNYVDCI